MQWRSYPLALESQDPDKNSEFYRTLQRTLIEDPLHKYEDPGDICGWLRPWFHAYALVDLVVLVCV